MRKSLSHGFSILVLLATIAACQSAPTPAPAVPTNPVRSTAAPTPSAPPTLPVAPTISAPPTTAGPRYKDAGLAIAQRVEDLLARMTLEAKIGQMTQVETNSIRPNDITARGIGSILSGGDGAPAPNNLDAWAKMVNGYQAYAAKTPLGIPLLYGVDAVHGFGGLRGATIFPHNIGLGATRDPDLVQRIARTTAKEMAAAGIYWNFAPVVAVPHDIRWGRTYEGYSENTDIAAQLGGAYVRGLRTGAPMIAATPKHFIGDGGTTWGTSRTNNYKLDQGDTIVDEAALRALYLPPYQAAIREGAQSIMVSFSSWNGVKMHAQKKLIADMLKGELDFKGFVVSDWAGINQISNNYDEAIVTSINAGLDMIMVPDKYPAFIDGLTRAVKEGKVPQSRIDDATRRILTVKFELGLFEKPNADPALAATVGSDAHRQLAREAVRKSLVLLKNGNRTLPLSKDTTAIYVAGVLANDVGAQCGGWTLVWQGRTGNDMPGTTILGGIQQAVSRQVRVEYKADGSFDGRADVGIVVVGETPYSEGPGDRADLSLSNADDALIDHMREHSTRLVVILISGRPMIITSPLLKIDAFVAAWLPGTEGAGVADVLFGDYAFTGKLPYTWPRWNSQLPFDLNAIPTEGCAAPLFPLGYGLGPENASPKLIECLE